MPTVFEGRYAATSFWVLTWIDGVLLASAPILLLLRRVGSAPLNSLWAEDGPVFLGQARLHSFPGSLFHPYGGYFHVPARLIGELATHVPIGVAPAVMNAIAALLAGVVAWTVFRVATYHLHSLTACVLLGLTVILLPAAGAELLDTVTNLHWYFLYGAFWAVVLPPKTRGDSMLAAAVVFAAATSDPLALALLPLVAYRALAGKRDTQAAVVTVAYAVGALIQTIGVLTAPKPDATHPSSVLAVTKAVTARVIAAPVAGQRLTQALLDNLGWVAVAVVAVGVVAAAWYALRLADKHTRSLVALQLILGGVLVAAGLALRWDDGMVPGGRAADPLGLGSRYFAVPNLCVVGALICGLERAFTHRTGTKRLAAAGVIVLAALSWAADFTVPNQSDRGPAWTTALVTAKAACQLRKPRSPDAPVRVTIAPQGWAIHLPCREVLRS